MPRETDKEDHPNSDSDSDALFQALEDEDDSAYRAHRIEQLNAEFASSNPQTLSSSSATLVEDTLYPTLKSDQILLDFTTQTHRCVIHFAHPDFARCGTMDEHIRALASRHHEVRFARVDVRNTPFVVEKLKIRVLPCVIGFKDGVGVERVVGFEGLGSGGRDGGNGFSTATLEKRLLWKGILGQAKFKTGEGGQLDDGSEGSDEDDEDDDGGRRRRRTIRTGNMRSRKRDDDDDDNDDDWD